MILRSIASVALVVLLAGSSFAAELSGDEIRREITGRRIYLAAPLGGEFPLNYRASGRIDGDGEALGLGEYVKPRDTGRWWITGNQLCQQFKSWYGGARLCFTLTRTGPNQLRWLQDNGDSGTARIGQKIK